MRAARLNQQLAVPAPKEIYNYQIFLLATISSMGAVMFGYDLGFIGTALELESFQNNRFGRRITLLWTALIFNAGSIIQTAAHGSTGALLAGRAVGGIGVGAASMIIPLYVAEASPPHIRVALVGIYEIGVSAGTLIGFWINYGLATTLPATSTQWIISFAVQLIPGTLLLVGLAFIPESPRWLAQHVGREACTQVLRKLRNIDADHPFLVEEVDAIFQQLEQEQPSDASNDSWKSLVREMAEPSNRKRLAIGSMMFVFMQMAGSNAINYFSPTIFASIGFTGDNTELFATGIYGLVRFVAILIAMLLIVDRFGRTRTLMFGSMIMAICMWYIGAYIKVAAPSASAHNIGAGGYAAITLIYVYAVGWSFSWAGIPWIYAAEIFPLRIRSPCVSICVTIHWVMNFVIARSVPYMIVNIGFGTYFVFAASMTLALPWVFFFVPETKNLGLEEMDALFGGAAPHQSSLEMEAKEDCGIATQLERV
ncbi:hypothetical protein E8E14_000860 [Neopestalotiopsis sp. 37M]|nr:hypothetical protein E8E14_000860 [Neopestalotiopsis sp. 37M]